MEQRTDQRQTVEEVREREEWYRSLFENANDGIFLLSREGRFMAVNQKFAELTGIPREKLIGQTTEIFLPGGFAQSLERSERTIREGTLGPYELEVTTPVGKKILSFNAVACFAGKTPVGVMSTARDITARKRMEEQLRESERRFRALFNQTSQFTGLLEPDGTLLEANKTALAFGGLQPEEVQGRPLWETGWILLENRERLKAAMADTARGALVRFEMDMQGAGGVLATIDFSLKPIQDETGQVVLLILEGRDITERKRMEAELRESEARLRAVVSGVSIILFAVDQEGVFTLSEGRGLEVLGRKPGEVVGQSCFEVYRNVPQIGANVRRALAGEEFIATVAIAGVVLEIRYAPLRDQNGAVTGVIGVATDITTRKQAEESSRIYAEIVRNMQIGLYVYQLEDINDDRTLRLVATNPAATHFTEVAMDRVVGKTLDENFPALRAQGIPQTYAEVVRSGQAVELEDVSYGDDRVLQGAFSVKAFPLPNQHMGGSV